MSTAVELIETARAAGVRFKLTDERLRIQADHEPPAELMEALRAHRAEVLAALKGKAHGTPDGMFCSDVLPLTWACEEICQNLDLDSRELEATLTAADVAAYESGKEGREVLRAYAHALTVRKQRERGEAPEHYTAVTVCRGCGPVPIFEGVPGRMDGCPWCWNRLRGLPMPAAGSPRRARPYARNQHSKQA